MPSVAGYASGNSLTRLREEENNPKFERLNTKFEVSRSHFSIGSPVMDDTEYLIIGSMRILGSGIWKRRRVFVKLPGVIPS